VTYPRALLLALLAAGALSACYLSDTYSGGGSGGISGASGQGGAGGKAGSGGMSGASGQGGMSGGGGTSGSSGQAGAGGEAGAAGQAGGAGEAGAAGAVGSPCEQVAAAYCGFQALRCGLSDAARGPEGRQRCEARSRAICEASRQLPGVTATDEQLQECAARFAADPAFDCDDLAMPLALCAIRGQRGDEEPCVIGPQCAGGLCGAKGGCGVCRQQAGLQAPCGTGISGCEPGLSCQLGTCLPRSRAGEVCIQDEDCVPGHRCGNALCQPLPSEVGAPCSSGSPCNPDRALFCEQQQCKTTAQRGSGEKCDPDAAVSEEQCPLGHRCKGFVLAASCKSLKPDGASCESTSECEPLSRCDGGTCQLFGCASGPDGG
jgi:hypothetical protein